MMADPQRWDALADLGTLRIQNTADRQRGIEELQRAFRLCPDPRARQQLARVIRQYGGDVPD